MTTIIAIQREWQENRMIIVFDLPLPPIYLIHDQVHQNLAGTGQREPGNVTQPDTGVNNVPDQFRIIAPSPGGGGQMGPERNL
jgi:hypothetical protein